MGSHTSLHRLPGMLLLGSTGRNSGKTEFACGVLNRFCQNHTLIGLKVTIIRDNDGACPRGGEGCGVCTSLEGPFDITEETNRDGIKDTSRMLRTGADRVFWLRVRSACVEEGLKALLEITMLDLEVDGSVLARLAGLAEHVDGVSFVDVAEVQVFDFLCVVDLVDREIRARREADVLVLAEVSDLRLEGEGDLR